MAPASKSSGTEAFLEKHTDHEADITEENNNGSKSYSSNPTITNALLLDTEDGATDCSSSFETTTSNALDVSRISDVEVESIALDRLIHPRKKKMTKHWRKFICPLMWRCKWTELRMMEIQSQGMNCARELALYNKQKLWESDPDALESIGSRSYPYFRQYQANKIMKRMKRRKVEDTIDVTSYISQHNLFSFVDNIKHDPNGFTTDLDAVNTVNTIKRAQSCYQFGINDTPLVAMNWDTATEELFQQLERVQSRVHKLKTQLEIVLSEHTTKLSSSEDLSLFAPFDGQFSTNHSPNQSVRGTYPPIETISDFDFEDLDFPDSPVSRLKESIDMDGILEAIVAELPAADVPNSILQITATDQKMVNDAPVDTSIIDTETPASDPTDAAPVHDTQVAQPGPSAIEPCLITDLTPKNKRKRGDRKVGSGNWIKRVPMSKGWIWATAEDLAMNKGRVLSTYRQVLRCLNSPDLPLSWAARLQKKAEVRGIFLLGTEQKSLHNIEDLLDAADYSISLLRKGIIPKLPGL